jgi:hypothetical protein
MNIILDPWNPEPFILSEGIFEIKGPFTNKNERFSIKFQYSKINNISSKLETVENESENFKHLYLKIKKDECIIENISKSSIYRGSEYMILGLQIIYRLCIKKSSLIDSAFFNCDTKMNFFSVPTNQNITKKEEIQNKLIALFRFQSTYYMPFGFRPISKETRMDITDEINSLLTKLNEISWESIDEYITLIKKSIDENKYPRNDFLIRNKQKWKNYWTNVYKSWKLIYEKYHLQCPTPFRSFILYNHNECHLFINWLELYSFRYIEYNQIVLNHINQFKTEIVGINEFKKLKTIINNVYWINDNVTSQSIKSIYISTI